MQTKTKILAALLLLTLVPAGVSAQAVVPIDLTINNITTRIAGVDVSEASATANDGRVLGGTTPVTVTLDVWAFDRNGETGVVAPSIGIYRPTGAGAPDCATTLANAADNIAFTGFTNGAAISAGSVDATATNGILKYSPTLTINSAGTATPPGAYCMVFTAAGGTVQKVTLVVYTVISSVVKTTSTAGAPDATIQSMSFGTQDPTASALLGSKLVRVDNLGSTPIKNTLTFSDVTNGAGLGVYDKILAANNFVITETGSVATTSCPGSCVPATPGSTANSPGGAYASSTSIASSNSQAFYAKMLSLTNNGQTNQVLKDGAYAGTITVTIAAFATGTYYDGTTYYGQQPDADYDGTPGVTDAFSTGAGAKEVTDLNPDSLGAITVA